MNFYTAPVYTQNELMQPQFEPSFPFTDENARYIGIDREYELTQAMFVENGISLEEELGSDPKQVAAFLKMLRKKTYGYLYSITVTPRLAIAFKIAKGIARGITQFQFRQDFLYAMYLLGVYLLKNDDVGESSGIDFAIMQNMSIDVMRTQHRDLSLGFERIIQSLNLNYAGTNRWIMPTGGDW